MVQNYSRKEQWEILDANVMPYHWEGKSKFNHDAKFLSSYYEEILILVSSKLNEIHCTNKGLRYWRIFIGPWLAYFIQMLFDRWESIHHAIEKYDLSGTVILEFEEGSFVPNDMNDFIKLFTEDNWNHEIFGIILKQYTKTNCIIQKPSHVEYTGSLSKKQSIKRYTKKQTRSFLSKIASTFKRDTDMFLINTYLPLYLEILLQIKLGQVPQLWKSNITPVRTKPNFN